MSDDTQKVAFAFLANPATLGGSAVKRVDTHAAAVFLAGDTAYKVKRAVKFPFLDFSTLDKRKTALEAENEANRPFATILRGDPDRVPQRLAGPWRGRRGRRVGLKMHRFDEEATLDRLAERGRIDRP